MKRITEIALSNIEDVYDPNNDISTDSPPVTWVEHTLLIAFRELEKRVQALEAQNKDLEQSVINAATLAIGESER